MIEHIQKRGILIAIAVVAVLLALFGYSLGYQNGNKAGLERFDWQFDLLATRHDDANHEAELDYPADAVGSVADGRCDKRKAR